MYIDTSHITRGGKTYTRHLLRESYRAHGKVLHRTIANVSHCSKAEIEALRLALRHKGELEHLGTIQDAITLKQGLSFGAVWTVYHVARRLGIEKALGTTREGKLALWQVMARVIDQGSRLSAVRLAMLSMKIWIGWRGPKHGSRIASLRSDKRRHRPACFCMM
jgi:hypothetical protein